jgi:hypothetical protein
MHVIHRLRRLTTPCRQVIQRRLTGSRGLFQCSKRGTGDPDGARIRARHGTPGSDVTSLPAEARTGPALVTDDKRETIACRAPNLHVGNEITDAVECKIDLLRALAQ